MQETHCGMRRAPACTWRKWIQLVLLLRAHLDSPDTLVLLRVSEHIQTIHLEETHSGYTEDTDDVPACVAAIENGIIYRLDAFERVLGAWSVLWRYEPDLEGDRPGDLVTASRG
jgi:hypothetical protein